MSDSTKKRSAGRGLLSVLAILVLLGCWAPEQARAQQRDPQRKVVAYGQAVTGGVALCTSGALTVAKETGAFRITVAVAAGATNSVFNVVVIPPSGASYTLALNGGTALTAGNIYTFTVGVDVNCTYDFTLTTTTTLAYLLVDESTSDGL
jgi:hypothetical protein